MRQVSSKSRFQWLVSVARTVTSQKFIRGSFPLKGFVLSKPLFAVFCFVDVACSAVTAGDLYTMLRARSFRGRSSSIGRERAIVFLGYLSSTADVKDRSSISTTATAFPLRPKLEARVLCYVSGR